MKFYFQAMARTSNTNFPIKIYLKILTSNYLTLFTNFPLFLALYSTYLLKEFPKFAGQTRSRRSQTRAPQIQIFRSKSPQNPDQQLSHTFHQLPLVPGTLLHLPAEGIPEIRWPNQIQEIPNEGTSNSNFPIKITSKS